MAQLGRLSRVVDLTHNQTAATNSSTRTKSYDHEVDFKDFEGLSMKLGAIKGQKPATWQGRTEEIPTVISNREAVCIRKKISGALRHLEGSVGSYPLHGIPSDTNKTLSLSLKAKTSCDTKSTPLLENFVLEPEIHGEFLGTRCDTPSPSQQRISIHMSRLKKIQGSRYQPAMAFPLPRQMARATSIYAPPKEDGSCDYITEQVRLPASSKARRLFWRSYWRWSRCYFHFQPARSEEPPAT